VVFAGTVGAIVTVAALTAPKSVEIDPALASGPKISFATAQAIVQTRCVTCHAEKPTNPSFTAPPLGVMFDTPERLKAHAQRIFVRAVQTHTMPLGNLTSMTEEERKVLGAWVAQGADIHAPGPAALPTAAPVAAPTYASAADEARVAFTQRCVPCHGAEGRGNGPSAAALDPKPRNYRDPEWQKAVSDERIALTILMGGAAMGKSPSMPGNPDLTEKPEVVSELVKLLRSFGKEGNP
jgi:uncharacterized membrane protein